MKEENNSKKKYVLFGIVIFLWLLLIGALSYAYFSVLFDNDEKTNAEVVSGLLSVDFTTGQYINNTSMWPINADSVLTEGEKSTFTVARSASNTVDNVYYNIYLEDIAITNNYKSADIKWRLYDVTSPTTNTTPISQGTFENIGSSTSLQLNSARISLPKNVTHEYSLFIWINNSTTNNQISLLNGSLEGKIKVIAVTE